MPSSSSPSSSSSELPSSESPLCLMRDRLCISFAAAWGRREHKKNGRKVGEGGWKWGEERNGEGGRGEGERGEDEERRQENEGERGGGGCNHTLRTACTAEQEQREIKDKEPHSSYRAY
eukprot:2173636-Rhodomonas_salina.1